MKVTFFFTPTKVGFQHPDIEYVALCHIIPIPWTAFLAVKKKQTENDKSECSDLRLTVSCCFRRTWSWHWPLSRSPRSACWPLWGRSSWSWTGASSTSAGSPQGGGRRTRQQSWARTCVAEQAWSLSKSLINNWIVAARLALEAFKAGSKVSDWRGRSKEDAWYASPHARAARTRAKRAF